VQIQTYNYLSRFIFLVLIYMNMYQRISKSMARELCVVFFLLFIVLCTSCRNATVPQTVIQDTGQSLLKEGEWEVRVDGLNLSEDMSSVSTKNDEVLLLIYKSEDSVKLGEPIFKKYLLFDSLRKSHSIIGPRPDSIPENILLFLLEEDTGADITMLDSVVRINHIKLKELFNKHDLAGLTYLLSDDDLLTVQSINHFLINKETVINVKGIIRADRYDYKITFRRP